MENVRFCISVYWDFIKLFILAGGGLRVGFKLKWEFVVDLENGDMFLLGLFIGGIKYGLILD